MLINKVLQDPIDFAFAFIMCAVAIFIVLGGASILVCTMSSPSPLIVCLEHHEVKDCVRLKTP